MNAGIEQALSYAHQYAQIDGAHHKAWVIDQMVRALTGCPMVARGGYDSRGNHFSYEAQGESEEYLEFVREHNAGEDGPDTYEWDEGIAP